MIIIKREKLFVNLSILGSIANIKMIAKKVWIYILSWIWKKQCLDLLKCRVLGAWNYFLSFPEQFPQVLKALGIQFIWNLSTKRIFSQNLFVVNYSCPFLQQKTLGFTTLSTIVIMLKPKKRKQFRFCKIQQNVKLGRLTENVEL